MAESDMVDAVQAGISDQGIDDTIDVAGQFEPRGMTGSLFAGGLVGGEVGGALGGAGDAIGLAAGSIAGMHAAADSRGLPLHMLVGVSRSTVYGFKMAAGGRRGEPHELLFRVPRHGLEVKVHKRVNVRALELIDADSGSKIELEGSRLPITHSHDVITYLVAGD
jgi:hypothetical protein